MQVNGLPSKSRTALLMINFDAKIFLEILFQNSRQNKGRKVAK